MEIVHARRTIDRFQNFRVYDPKGPYGLCFSPELYNLAASRDAVLRLSPASCKNCIRCSSDERSGLTQTSAGLPPCIFILQRDPTTCPCPNVPGPAWAVPHCVSSASTPSTRGTHPPSSDPTLIERNLPRGSVARRGTDRGVRRPG